MKWAAVLVVVVIAIEGLPALNLPLGISSNPGKETRSGIDVGISKAAGVMLTKTASLEEHLKEANQEGSVGKAVSQSEDATSFSQTDLESRRSEAIEQNRKQEDAQALSVGGQEGLLESQQTSIKSRDVSKTQEEYKKEKFTSHEISHKGGTTVHRESLSESGGGSEDSDESNSHTEYSQKGQDGIGSGDQGLFNGFQARSSLAHRGPIRPFSHISNHGPSETQAYNQHRNYASENGHYGSRNRNHSVSSRHIGNFGANNGDHRNGFWNNAYNSEQFARGAGNHRNNHFSGGNGNRHQGASFADNINHSNDTSRFSEGGYQDEDASAVNFVDLASDTENQETNSGEYDNGNVFDEPESRFKGSGYVDESFRRGPGKGVNQFVSEPENEEDNSGQYGSKVAVDTGDLKEVIKRGLNKHFISATGNQAHSGKYNAIARHGYQGNANGDLRGFINRPHFENQKVNPGKYINGIFVPTDDVNYGSGNGYHTSPNEYLNRLLNHARGRLSYPRPVKPRPVPVKYINGGFAQGGHNDQYDIEDDEEVSQDANEKYISDILTQAQHLLKHGAVPNGYGVTPAHQHPGPQRGPLYETPNFGIRFYDTPTGSYLANPASTADDDDTYEGVAPGYLVPAEIVPEFNSYPNGQFYGPNYYRNGGFGSGPSFIPGIDMSGPTTIFGRNPSVLPLSTIPVRKIANIDNAVVIDKTLAFDPLPPLNPFKPLSPLPPLTPLPTFDTDYEGTNGDASEIIIDKDLLRGTFESASSLKKDGTTVVINKDLRTEITHTDSDNDENSKIDNGAPTDKTVLPKQTDKPVKGNEKIDEASTKNTKDDDKLVAVGKDDDKTITNPGKSIIIDKNTVTKHIYDHGDVSKNDKTVKSIEKVLETNEKSGPIENKEDGTINYDKSNEKTATKKDSGKDDNPNSNDNDEISKTGKSFVIDKTLVINTIYKDKSGNGKENKDQTSTKTREVSGTESESETLYKSDEGNTTNGKSNGKHLKDFGKNYKTVEEVKRDLEKDGSLVFDKADDKKTKPVKAIVIQNDLGTAEKADINNNDGSNKNSKTSDKNTEIKNADKDGNGTDKKDITSSKYDKSDDTGKINDVITKNDKSTVTENADKLGKDNVKTTKTDDTVSKSVHNNDDDSIKNGESIVIGKTTVIKTIHKDKIGTETIDETSTETKEVVGNDGKLDSNEKSDNETTKNSKSEKNKGLKDSDRKSKTIEKIKKKLGKPDHIGKDNGANTKLVKTIFIDKENVIKNFLRKDDRLNSTGKYNSETTKKSKSKLTEGTDKDGQEKNTTDKTIEKIDDTSDAIDKKNDNAIYDDKSIGIKNTTLIKKDLRKDDVLDNIDHAETTKNRKSTVADKSRGVKNEKKIKKVSGTDDEPNKNNDVGMTAPGISTVTDNSSAVKNAGKDGEDETPEGGILKRMNIKSVTKNIQKDRTSENNKLTESDKTFRNNNGYTTNDDKQNDSNRAIRKAVGGGNDNGSNDKAFHDYADNVESGKDSKYGNNGNKNESKSSEIGQALRRKGQNNDHGFDSANSEKKVGSADGKKQVSDENGDENNNVGKEDESESDDDSVNEDSVSNKNDQTSRSGKGGKSDSRDSKKDKKKVGSHKSDGDSINKDSVHNENDQPSRSGKGGKSGSRDNKKDKKEVESHKSDGNSINEDSVDKDDDLSGKSGKGDKSPSNVDDQVVGSKNDDAPGTSGKDDKSESKNGIEKRIIRSDNRDRDCDDETEKDLEQNDDETNYDDIENDATSNDEQQKNGFECGDNSNNEDREDDNENVLFGKSDGKKVFGSETGENKDSNKNYEDASSNTAKSDESGQSGGQKDNKVENDDAPEKSGEDGKYRNQKAVGSENGENKDSDEVDNESGNTGDKNDKTVVGSENNDTPKKSGKDGKSRNNSNKKDENVVEPKSRNNKYFHENAKDASCNNKEDDKFESERGHKRRNHTNIGKVVGDKNPRDTRTDSPNSGNDGNSEDDKLTETSEKPKIGQDENNNTNAGDDSINKGSDNNDDGNTSKKSDNDDKSGKIHGHKRRIHSKIGTVAGHKENNENDFNKSENDEILKDDKLIVTSEKSKPHQDGNNDSKKDGSDKSDNSGKEVADGSDDDITTDKSVKNDKSGKLHGHKQNHEINSTKSENDEISKDDKLSVTSENPKTGQDANNDGTNDESKNKDSDDDNVTGQSGKDTKSRKNNGQKHKIINKIGTTVVNKKDHETDKSAKPKSSQDENNDTKHADSSVIENLDAHDSDKSRKRDTSEKRKHERKVRNKIYKILKNETVNSENNEDFKKVNSTSNNDNQVTDEDESNNDDYDIVTGQSGKGDESVGKGDKNDGKNLGSENGENVNLDEDASEKFEKENHGRKHEKSHKFIGRNVQKKDRSKYETSEGVKSTEINEKPVSNKPGQGKNNSHKKTATVRKINRNHGYENGEDTSREDSDDESKLSDNSGKGGKLGRNDGIKDIKDAGFENENAPEKSEKGGTKDKALGLETGDNKTSNEHDDHDAGVAEKGKIIHDKKHKKSHKVVGRKGHKKDHETDLLKIDNTETSEGVKSTDINKTTTSNQPGQEKNTNDEKEETEKKINRNRRSENGEDRENSDDSEDELSKKSGKGGIFVQKDKKVAVSGNDDASKKSEGGKPKRHGGKQDKAVETENGNKEYSKEHDDDDKGAAEKSNKDGSISDKKHKNSQRVHKVVERKGLKNDHVTDSVDNEKNGVSKQVKSTIDNKKPVSDENSVDQKDETVNKINKEVGSVKGDRLTNEARDGETNEDGKQTEITDNKLRIRDYRIKNNATKTKKDLQSSNVNVSRPNDRVDDAGKHSKASKLTDKNTKLVNRNEKHKIRTKILKRVDLQNHESGDHSDSDTEEKSQSSPNSKKAVTEETGNNNKNDKTSTTDDVSGHEDETSDGSNSAVKDKHSKTKKHNHRDTTNNGNKDNSSQVIRKHANTKDKGGSITDDNTSKDNTSTGKDSSSDSENNSANDNEQQDSKFKKDSTNNSNADKTTDDLEHEDTTASSENDDDVSKNTTSEKENTSDSKNTAVIDTSKAKPKIHRRTTDIPTKTRNLIKRKTTADSTSGKTTETDDGLGKTEETSNRNTAVSNSSDNYDEEKSSSTSTDNKKGKTGSQSTESISSSTDSEGESKTSSTDTKKESSDNQSEKSSSSSNETAGRQSEDEAKSKSYKNRKEESSETASGYASGAEQEILTKDREKATYKKSSKDSAHSEQQEGSKYTEESRDSKGKTVQSEQRRAPEEEESDGKTKKSKKDSASAEDEKNQESSSSEYKNLDSNGNTAARNPSSRRKSFKSRQSSSAEEEYSSSS